MRRELRKIIVFVLSFAMVMFFSIPASAEESEHTGAVGDGQIAGIVKPDVYQVVLPTDVDDVFDFILDPQRLIEETDAVAFGGKSFEKGSTVFFQRSDGQSIEDYSSSSDHVSIINRSNIPVDVLVNVSISQESLGGITMTGDRTFTNDANASLYMALTDGQYIVPVGTEDAYIQTTIPAAPEEAFEYSYDQESGEYTYGLKEDLTGIQFPEYSFQLTGAVNENGDWAAVGKVSPLVTITWKVTRGEREDSREKTDLEQNRTQEQSAVFNQLLETSSIENEIKEKDITTKSTKRTPEKNNADLDNKLTNDAVSDESVISDKNDTPNESITLDEKSTSDGNITLDEESTLDGSIAPDIDKTSDRSILPDENTASGNTT